MNFKLKRKFIIFLVWRSELLGSSYVSLLQCSVKVTIELLLQCIRHGFLLHRFLCQNICSFELFHQPTLMHNFLYSLTICFLHYYPRHVSSINMPIFRKKNCIHTASGIFALCKRLHSTPVESGGQKNVKCVLGNCSTWRTNSFQYIYSYSSTCFESVMLIIRRNRLYQCSFW